MADQILPRPLGADGNPVYYDEEGQVIDWDSVTAKGGAAKLMVRMGLLGPREPDEPFPVDQEYANLVKFILEDFVKKIKKKKRKNDNETDIFLDTMALAKLSYRATIIAMTTLPNAQEFSL